MGEKNRTIKTCLGIFSGNYFQKLVLRDETERKFVGVSKSKKLKMVCIYKVLTHPMTHPPTPPKR